MKKLGFLHNAALLPNCSLWQSRVLVNGKTSPVWMRNRIPCPRNGNKVYHEVGKTGQEKAEAKDEMICCALV